MEDWNAAMIHHVELLSLHARSNFNAFQQGPSCEPSASRWEKQVEWGEEERIDDIDDLPYPG